MKPVVNGATDLLAGNGDDVILLLCNSNFINCAPLNYGVNRTFFWSTSLYIHVLGMEKVNLRICLL